MSLFLFFWSLVGSILLILGLYPVIKLFVFSFTLKSHKLLAFVKFLWTSFWWLVGLGFNIYFWAMFYTFLTEPSDWTDQYLAPIGWSVLAQCLISLFLFLVNLVTIHIFKEVDRINSQL